MLRSVPPPRRVLVVAAAVAGFPADEAGWRCVSDAAVRERTGYKPRTVRLAFQELADLGAAEVGRAADGDTRLVRPLPHPLWAAALALVPTADEGAVQ